MYFLKLKVSFKIFGVLQLLSIFEAKKLDYDVCKKLRFTPEKFNCLFKSFLYIKRSFDTSSKIHFDTLLPEIFIDGYWLLMIN